MKTKRHIIINVYEKKVVVFFKSKEEVGGREGKGGWREEVEGKRSKVSGRDVLGGTAGRQAASTTRGSRRHP